MNRRLVLHMLGKLLLLEVALLMPSLLVAYYYKDDPMPFWYTIGIVLAVSIPLYLAKPNDGLELHAREGFAR